MAVNLIISAMMWATVFSGPAYAAELKGVTMPETVEVPMQRATTKLVLNGMGLRVVHRFGIPIKVYVGGLYLPKKSQDSAAILASADVKHLKMQFVRAVDRDALVSSFKSGYDSNCMEQCEDGKLFAQLRAGIVNVRKGNQILFTFYPDHVDMETTGPYAKKVTLTSPALSKNVLALFISSKNPPTKEFRSGLLGLK